MTSIEFNEFLSYRAMAALEDIACSLRILSDCPDSYPVVPEQLQHYMDLRGRARFAEEALK